MKLTEDDPITFTKSCDCNCHDDSEFHLIQDDCDLCWTKHIDRRTGQRKFK